MSAQVIISAADLHNLIDFTIDQTLTETLKIPDTCNLGDVHRQAWNLALYGRTTE